MSDTPETDALPMTDDPLDFIAMIEHARKLERERDEAREQLAIAKSERNAAHLKCHRIAEEIMAWLADPQPNNTTPPATSK